MTPDPKSAFYAHSGRKADFSDWQELRVHLRQVAQAARALAGDACPCYESLARATELAGWLHDLGKYRPGFQQMIRGLSVPREQTYHKQAGAVVAADARNLPVAFAVLGHHGGIPNAAESKDLIAGPSGRPIASAIWGQATRDCPQLGGLALDPPPLKDRLAADLITRLIFSCLVDADWTDTGTHERRVKGLPPEPLPPPLDPASRLERVLAHIRRRAATCREAQVARVRDDILNACLTAAGQPPGLFSLTVPTGGGKTLSGLALALKHAAAHGLRRLIYVAPYLSILDQNARVIRQALGVAPDAPDVFEHHTLADPPGDETQQETAREAAARRAENWDAPVVLTTNVQFFESLFANKPGRCRKLHNIARSVILLDECQTLPPELVAPTCSMLGDLAPTFGSTVILCTATQPAFDHADMPERLQNVREIIPASLALFARLRRVQVAWPKRDEAPLDWPAVAGRMRDHRAALCIVNTRRAARELFAELRQGGGDVFHLSTSMCPAHRLAVLDEVRWRLEAEQPCYLASTQLIEAGVDVDFPFVMRELAPLEAIIQSAGRCNREGRLRGADGSPGGRVVVFRSVEGILPRDRWYRAGRTVLETSFLNAGREPGIDTPSDIREYFERLYREGDLDERGIQDGRRRFAFTEVAGQYRLIDDDGDSVVVATWQEKQEEVEALLDAVRLRPTRANFRRLAPFQVNLRRYERDKAGGAVAEEGPGLLVWRGPYDDELGLTGEAADWLLVV
jgi:CRISPR-associated endonuclease/helicase Cas3